MALAMEALEVLRSTKVQGDDKFFDRENEMRELLQLIEVCNNRIALVLGPNNSGKSTLLKRLRAIWDANPDLKVHLPLFHMDMRLSDYKTPELAAASIAVQMRSWASFLKDLVVSATQVLVTFKGISLNASQLLAKLDKEPANELASVMSWFTRIAYENPNKTPIFIIDEADRLKQWAPEDVATLLGGFVAMTKQDKNAVVILSSSDDVFRFWFKDHVNASQWTAMGVGHFRKADAEKLLSKLVEKHALTSSGSTIPDDWRTDKVYDVCGGCPQVLENCVIDVFRRGKELGLVLDQMVVNEVPLIEQGLEGGEWDGVRFEKVMRLVVERTAVAVSVVCREVYDGNRILCNKEVMAMVARNVIHLRYFPPGMSYSDLQDFDRGGANDASFVMATSPTHAVAMKRYLEQVY